MLSLTSPRHTSTLPILLKNPLFWRPHLGFVATVSEANCWLSASCGEDRRREGDELRQFPQILGGGG